MLGPGLQVGRGHDFSLNFILLPENHLAAIRATQISGCLVAQENATLSIGRAKKSTCRVILWEQRRTNAQSPKKTATSLAGLQVKASGAAKQPCAEMRCVDIPGLQSQPTVAAYGDSQATTYKRHSHQGKLLTCIPPRTVRKASSWLSALCINTINPPAKNAGHHQAFLTSPSFYLSLQILLFILPLSLFSLSLSSFISLSFALYPFWIYSKMFNYLIT